MKKYALYWLFRGEFVFGQTNNTFVTCARVEDALLFDAPKDALKWLQDVAREHGTTAWEMTLAVVDEIKTTKLVTTIL